ncbi:MAG: lipocalin-like domain-containing protein [Pseudomonadota bacterium]|nr:lipocalin-like domain-containing protein [Pseudomonadota bacterium]
MRALVVLVTAVVLGLSVVYLTSNRDSGRGDSPAGAIDLSQAFVEEGISGFERAVTPRSWDFPEDHGPHEDFASEWWYFTGNLKADDGRDFGYELTFFRVAVAPDMPQRASDWATRQIYMAHLALTDVAAGEFHAFERFNRAALAMAGAQAQPLRVWLDDWELKSLAPQGPAFPARLTARQGDVAIELVLASDKPPVLQGREGLSVKGQTPGDASYYYSLTRMPTQGHITLGEEIIPVSGASWMDREWGTSTLGEDRVGWDWFSVQLDDGRELMFCQIRRRDGAPNPFDYGVLVDADGSYHILEHDAVVVTVRDHWRSPHSGIRYPSGWTLELPSESLQLRLEPAIADQELNLAIRYWEGLVQVTGTDADGRVSGHGYVELTGYGAAP